MESEQRWKRKRKHILSYWSSGKLLSVKSVAVCMSLFVFLLFVSSDHRPTSFRPVLRVTNLSFLPSRLAFESFNDRRTLSPLVVEGRVLFPDHLMLIVSSKIQFGENLECVYYYYKSSLDETAAVADGGLERVVVKPALSFEEFHENKSIVRCSPPPRNYSAAADLRWVGDQGNGGRLLLRSDHTAVVPSCDKVVYEAVLDWNTAVVFVKGLNLRPHRDSDAKQFRCHFGLSSFDRGEGFVFTTEATAAAQEVIRCLLPRSIRNNTEKAVGTRVTISRVDAGEDAAAAAPLPSVAKVYSIKSYQQRSKKKKYDLCACTMMWNQASFLTEWVIYHGWLGVERWFIYDNNSDDGLTEVIDELNLSNYNISRHAWPWIKAQEAGFSHCALRARHECKWLGFFDVDEFFYFPHHTGQESPGQNSLRTLITNYTDSPTYAEIRTLCHNFGPSGLTSVPLEGVTIGYTCRLQAPERHKSFVRPELLDITLLNAVHHFRLREGYKSLNVPESTAVVNHYKYQVWDTFKAKFFRRVSTYVTNWQDGQNKGSRDRAPGLGTEAIEPRDWRLRFCEVWDTGLKDFVLAKFADSGTGFLPWERSRL